MPATHLYAFKCFLEFFTPCAGEALSSNLSLKLGSQFKMGFRAEFERRSFLGTLQHPIM